MIYSQASQQNQLNKNAHVQDQLIKDMNLIKLHTLKTAPLHEKPRRKQQQDQENFSNDHTHTSNTNIFLSSFVKKDSNEIIINNTNNNTCDLNNLNNNNNSSNNDLENRNQLQATNSMSFNNFSHYHSHIPTLNMSM